MEPENSLPFSQESATGLYSKPDESNPQPPAPFFEIHLKLSSHLSPVLRSGFPLQVSQLSLGLNVPLSTCCQTTLIIIPLIWETNFTPFQNNW
jgi:hypothetical protein